jgi:hypothetical protein
VNASSPHNPTQASTSASPPNRLESMAPSLLHEGRAHFSASVDVEHRHGRIDRGHFFPDALDDGAGMPGHAHAYTICPRPGRSAERR